MISEDKRHKNMENLDNGILVIDNYLNSSLRGIDCTGFLAEGNKTLEKMIHTLIDAVSGKKDVK